MKTQREVSIEFDRGPVTVVIGDQEIETRGMRCRAYALLTRHFDAEYVCDTTGFEWLDGREWKKLQSLPPDEVEIIEEHLREQAEAEEAEDLELESIDA